jgi:hypothetical protein
MAQATLVFAMVDDVESLKTSPPAPVSLGSMWGSHRHWTSRLTTTISPGPPRYLRARASANSSENKPHCPTALSPPRT